MRLVGLGGRIGDVVGPGEHGVLRGDVDDVPAHGLVDHHPRRLAGDEERAPGHHVVLQVPVLGGGLQQRLGQRQPGVVDDQVEPAEGEDRLGRRPARRPPRRRHRRAAPTALSGPPSSSATCSAFSRFRSAITTQAPSATSRSAVAFPMPEPPPVTSATRVASGFGCGLALQLRLLERPVLDAELLRLVDRGVGGDRLRAAHHVDGVDVELAGHSGGLLVGAEGEHAHARDQHDRRIGAADRGGVRRRRDARSRRCSRRGTPRAAPCSRATESSRLASEGRSSTSGFTLVRRK